VKSVAYIIATSAGWRNLAPPVRHQRATPPLRPRETTAWVKLSGLVTEAGPDWSVDRLRPYVDHLLEHFGPDRLIFGSDWPVVTLAASYAEWLTATEALLAVLDSESRSRIMGRNARECYRLQSPPSLEP
jgi:predicted TIM-barrel fold metal-dependent hydrolase